MKTLKSKTLSALCLAWLCGFASTAQNRPPNVIIIYTDDLGYGDLSSYGNPTIHTPELDQMAGEGMKLTQFYVAAPVCTPSRAALMTGCYPKRVGLEKGVLFPTSATGLHPQETTLAEMLKQRNYATACIGKWHLGHHDKFMPYRQGFDVFYGIPYSNDMSKKEQERLGNKKYPWVLPLYEQEDTIALDPDQRNFTKDFTRKALDFIRTHQKEPFFLYLAHPMPHIPIYASDQFQHTSTRGAYGDTIEEIDWSVGQILKALKTYKIDKNTLVLFTSDNGPWKVYKTEGGSSGPLRGAKGTTWEGGMRVPFIAWWPGTIPASSLRTQVVTNMDLLPTIANLCDAPLPEKTIDGRDVSSILLNEKEKPTARPFLYYSQKGEPEGIREGKFKFLMNKEGTFLFDVESDISEQYNLLEKMPMKAAELKEKLTALDKQLTAEKREAGRL